MQDFENQKSNGILIGKEVENELTKKRNCIKTFNDLLVFLKDVHDNYRKYDYRDDPIAIAQACIAVARFLSGDFGLSFYQTNIVMWEFILGYVKTENKTRLRLIDYDDMLLPQDAYRFEKVINQETWESIQKYAEDLLRSYNRYDDIVHPDVLDHWKSIVDGNVPFGYTVGIFD